MTYQNRLKKALELRQRDYAWLAEQIGISKQATWLVVEGKTKSFSAQNHMLAAAALEVNPYWLANGIDEMVVTDSLLHVKKIPVIELSQASNWAALDFPKSQQKLMVCPIDSGPNTYAIKIVGESMLSNSSITSFKEGQIVFVDPDIKPEHGDFVVIKIPGIESSLFKRLIVDGDQYYIESINKDWPNRIAKLDAMSEFCGVYIGAWTPKSH